MHHIEGLRRDVFVVDVLLVKYSWYLGYMNKEQPDLMSKVRRIPNTSLSIIDAVETFENHDGFPS